MVHTAIPIITIISYAIGEIYKLIFRRGECKKFIPLVMAVIGACLGVGVYYAFPDTIASRSIYDAIASGIVSGESATGANQIIKQLFTKSAGEQKND